MLPWILRSQQIGLDLSCSDPQRQCYVSLLSINRVFLSLSGYGLGGVARTAVNAITAVSYHSPASHSHKLGWETSLTKVIL